MTGPSVVSGDDERPATATQLAQLLDVHVDDVALLEQALTHRSWAFENGVADPNERLELLGDAVLALVVTDEIFHAHPAEQEGRLAKLRSAAVKTGSLADIARAVGLGGFIKLGRGEARSGGADKDSILADTLEAVFGAIYLDRGFATAYELIQRLLEPRLNELAGRSAALDYKTALQELSAAQAGSLPRYEVSATGPDHERTFVAEVFVADVLRGRGQGRNKKQAEQRAAQQAYEALEVLDEDLTVDADSHGTGSTGRVG